MTNVGAKHLKLSLLSLLVAACGSGDAPASEVADYGEPVPGGTAVIAESADMSIPVIIVSQTLLDGNLGGDVLYMSVLATDWDDGRLVFETSDQSPMAISRRYEYIGPDSASLRFHMRSDLQWSDGEPLTAEDVVYTYEILAEPDLASPVQNYTDELESVVAEDDSTVVFHFARRYPEMLMHASLQVIPEHVFGGTPASEFRNHPTILDPTNGNLVVSGPFMIGSWERGARVVLVRNPEFEPRAYLDQLVFRVIPEQTTRLVELQTGAVDFVKGPLSFDQIPQLREQTDDVRFETEDKRTYDYIGYNGGGFEPFADPEIRRALGMAIDIPSIIEALQMEEFAVAAGGPYSPIFRDLYDPEEQTPLEYDPEEARRIFESKGWSDTDGDGVLDRDGRPFRFTLVTNAANQRRADIAQIVQEQWAQISVDAQIQIREFNTMMDELIAGDYQAVLAGWNVALSPDIEPLFGEDSPFNHTNYTAPGLAALMDEAQSAPTPEAAAPIWRDVASRIVSDQPYTWLFYMDVVNAASNRLRGTEIDTYGTYQNTWEWWIPEELRRGE